MAELPVFQPKFFEDILKDMVNLVRTNIPELTDFNIGSRIRSILEVCALEDDEQYHQMVQLLRLWNLRNLRGRALDERLAEWNVTRRGAIAAGGQVVFGNEGLTTSFLKEAAAMSGVSTTIILLSSKGFPLTSSAPYTIRIGEDTANVEDVTVSMNNPTTGTLTVTALANNHAANERVSLVTGSVFIVSRGMRVRVPENSDFPDRVAITVEQARVEPGNYESAPVLALMEAPGNLGKVTEGAISEFVSQPPFDGAIVRNSTGFAGGLDEESDQQFLSRGLNRLQSLSAGTPLSLKERVKGAQFTDTTGRVFRVISANLKSFFFPDSRRDYTFLYIWAGTFDFIETLDVGIESLTTSAEDGQRFFRLDNIAIVPNSLILQLKPVGTATFQTLTQGTDYFLNEGTGRIQIVDPGLNEGDELQAAQYKYYGGLINQAQLELNGSETDPQTYPGFGCEGIITLVTFPRPRELDPIRLSIQVRPGFSEASVALLVEQEITNYLRELTIGEDVIVSEIIERAMGVDGMLDLQISSPTENIVLLEDEILDLEDLDVLVS